MEPRKDQAGRERKRARPHLPVYIYGETAVAERKARALESGAVSDATDEVLDRLTDPDPVARGIDTALDDRLAKAADSYETHDVTAESPDAYETRDVDGETPESSDAPVEPNEPDEPAVEEHAAPVQVPWLSRAGGPLRRGPDEHTHIEDAAAPVSTPGENAPIRGPHEPLLTDEELRALMGDDLPNASSADPFDEGDRP